ncbi:MAG: histidine utilization repressor [Halofilum sp. (in: g-proteobacteria)]|nr:histidine utilization repressor [Halofilum sp. (in: g-proteobacteria)]
MPADRTAAAETVPLYARVKHRISDAIASGEWPPGHRVPSESELVREMAVSRMTVNRALRELTADGLLVRVQGVGTFVAEQKPHAALFDTSSIADDIAARGHRHAAEVVRLERVDASAATAQAFGLAEGASLFHSLVVHSDDRVPVLLEDRHVDPELAPGYLDQDYTATTAHDYLMSIAPPSRVEHIVEAVVADAAERRLLKIGAHEPCLLMRRRTWWGDRVVSAARLLYPGTRYRLEGRFVHGGARG